MASEEAWPTLVEALASSEPEIVSIERTERGTLALAYPDLLIGIEADADEDRFVLAAPLAQPLEEGRAGLLKALLQQNLLWRDTEGVRMGLDEEGRAVLIADLPLSSLDADVLATATRNFVLKARLWRVAVASGGGKAATDRPGPDVEAEPEILLKP